MCFVIVFLPSILETSKQVGLLSGHSEAPTNVSFTSDGNFCLSVASCEGFIWDLQSLAQAHRLNLQPDMTIKQVGCKRQTSFALHALVSEIPNQVL